MRRSTFLPLTLRGAFMCAVSLAVLAIGILRTDMAGLFWGSSFLLVILYAVAGNIFTRIIASRGRKRPGFLEAHLPASVLSAGETAEARAGVSIPRVLIPGFSVIFSLPLRWHERHIDTVRTVLAPGRNSKTIAFRAEKRGKYAAHEADLQVRDILGFTSSAVRIPLEETLAVFPRIPGDARPARSAEEGGDSVRFTRHRRRSEELLEVRKYFPGDDIRKLNWKVYAHSSELFLRIGEETPPPESRLFYILDATVNPAVPARGAADFLDGMVEACAAEMVAALSRGVEVLFIPSGAVKCASFTEESRPDLLALLAGVWWTEAGWKLPLPARRRIQAVVFSTPGSPCLDDILATLTGRGWKVTLMLRDLPLPARRWKTPSLKSLLFVPAEPA